MNNKCDFFLSNIPFTEKKLGKKKKKNHFFGRIRIYYTRISECESTQNEVDP